MQPNTRQMNSVIKEKVDIRRKHFDFMHGALGVDQNLLQDANQNLLIIAQTIMSHAIFFLFKETLAIHILSRRVEDLAIKFSQIIKFISLVFYFQIRFV